MKISKIESTKIQIKRSNRLANYQSNSCVINGNRQITKYNPLYYKPIISFKGDDFESYFPTKTLGYNEQSFNDLILSAIQNPQKKQRIINCITNATERNHKTMEFVNMWKRAVPTIVSQSLFANLTGQGASELAYRFGTQGIASKGTSPIKKFFESDYQTDIIKKEAKSVTAGVISSKLFIMGVGCITANPPIGIGLVTAATVVGGLGHKIKGKDSKKILDKQFVDATKELIKWGVVDPYNIINSTKDPKEPLELSADKLKEYKAWKYKRILDLRYYKTGSYKNLHNDFNTIEGLNVLDKCLETLTKIGFSDKFLSNFLSIMGLLYRSGKAPLEAQHLLGRSLEIQKNLYGEHSIKLLDTLKDLAAVQEENEEPINTRNTLKEILRITETSTPNDIEAINKAKKNLLISDLKLTLELEEKEKILKRDYDVSTTNSRCKKIKDTLLPLVINNKKEAVDSSSNLINELLTLDLNKKEYVEIFKYLNKYKKDPMLEELGEKLLKKWKLHPFLKELNYNDMPPELYAKFTQGIGDVGSWSEKKSEHEYHLYINISNTISKPEWDNPNIIHIYKPSKALKQIDKELGENSLYKAHFLEGLDENSEVCSEAYYIYKEILGDTSVDAIKCKIKNIIFYDKEDKMKNMADYLEKFISVDKKELLKDEIANLYMKLGQKMPKTESYCSLEVLDKYIEFFGKAIEYNPNRANEALYSIREKYPDYCQENLAEGAGYLKTLSRDYSPITGYDGFESAHYSYSKYKLKEKKIIENLLCHIKGNDTFAINKRFLLSKKRDAIWDAFYRDRKKGKVNDEIRRIESNLEFMKIK